MRTRAAVAVAAGQPLEVMEVNLDGPKAGEVLVEIKATGICHTDEFTLSGADPEGMFPAILGHEGAGVVLECGPGVTSLKPGDHVIPLYTPECRTCEYCLNPKTNLCQAIRETQGRGVMPDGTSRFSMLDGTPILHYMGCSTFANHTVLPEIALAKINPDAPFDKVCYIGCGVTTGLGIDSAGRAEGDVAQKLFPNQCVNVFKGFCVEPGVLKQRFYFAEAGGYAARDFTDTDKLHRVVMGVSGAFHRCPKAIGHPEQHVVHRHMLGKALICTQAILNG